MRPAAPSTSPALSSRLLPWSPLLWLAHGLLQVWLRLFHPDEGTYLAAAALLRQGFLPYRDFFFLQTPLYPVVYALPQSVFGDHLLTARLTSLVLTGASLALLARIAGRFGGVGASSAVWLLAAFTPFPLSFSVIARIFALAQVMLAAGLFLLFTNSSEEKAPWVQALGILCLGGMVLSRLTTAPILLAAVGWYVLQGSRDWRRWAGLTCAGCLCLAFLGYFYFQAPAQARFGLLEFHLMLGTGLLGGFWKMKAYVTLQSALYFALPGLFALFWLGGKIRSILLIDTMWRIRDMFPDPSFQGIQLPPRFGSPRNVLALMLAFGGLLTLLGHFWAKLPQTSYQTVVFPLLLLPGAIQWSRWRKNCQADPEGTSRLHIILLVTQLALSYSSLPPLRFPTAWTFLHQQVAALQSHIRPGGIIVSSDTPLAVIEAGRKLHLSFTANEYFPRKDRAFCEKYHVVNDEILKELFAAPSTAAVLIGDRSYSLGFPTFEPVPAEARASLLQTLQENFSLAGTFPNVYDRTTRSYLYVRPQ